MEDHQAANTNKTYMKRFFIALIICCCAIPVPVVAGGGNGKVKLIVTLLTGAAAAEAAKKADAAGTIFHQKQSIVDKLIALGIDPNNLAIYSTYLKLDKNASAIKWERWIGWPNVFLEVEIAGKGSFLIPRIEMEYQGQPILEKLIGEYSPPGTRIIVNVYDDKKAQKTVWDSILQTRINTDVGTGIIANRMLKAAVQTDGSLLALDKGVTILKPVCMATADFRVPNSADGRWLADASFLDNDGHIVGKLQLRQMWLFNPPAAASQAHSQYVSWIVVTGLIAGMFFVLLCIKQKKN